uniref:Death domain-containing protein n=1 Tax=Caenorhabditis tropicalis TaxID=1561998 RepID=A0A1I7U6C4_9PELO
MYIADYVIRLSLLFRACDRLREYITQLFSDRRTEWDRNPKLSDSVCNLDYLTRIRVSKIFDDQSKWQRLAQQLDCDHMIELIAICSAGDDSSPTMILLDQFEQLDDSSISRLREAMNRMEEEEGVKLIDSRYVY